MKTFPLAVLFTLFAAAVVAAETPPRPPPPDFESNLPIVALDATCALSRDAKTPGTVRLLPPKGVAVIGTNSWPAAVRYPGASSLGYPKKSFAFSLTTPARLLDLRESAHWVLNAAFIDRSLMRHKLSYDLFRSLSATNASRFAAASRFVEVFFNGEHQGAYLLMERVDRPMAGLRIFNSNEVNHAVIYKAIDHAANFGHAGHGGFEQREPDPLVKEHWRPLDLFTRFVSGTADAAFWDATNGLAARLDLDNAIDFHLLVLLTSNLDGITKNFLLARDAVVEGQPRPRFFFMPWDYDGTFGRNWDASPVAPDAWLSNHLFDRLMNHRPYVEKFARRWRQLREREFAAKTVQDMIDANARTLGEAARRNAIRWRGAAGYHPGKLSWEEDLAQMKSWVEARGRWLDGEIARRTAAPR